MLEERIKNLIEKRDLKQKELENLREQRTHRNPYTGLDGAHEIMDASLNVEIRFLEKSIRELDEIINECNKIVSIVDEERITYGTRFNFSLDNGFTKTVTLVERMATGEENEYITDKSPVGKAVKGLSEGETFSYLAPNGLQMNGIINEVYKKQAKQK